MPQASDLLVIGTGITGLSAAKRALQNGLTVTTMEALLFGGLVINVNELDGELQGSGTDLAAGMMLEARKLGGQHVAATASGITREGDALIVTSDAGSHRARAVIVASGGSLKRLGVPGEAEFEGLGVSHCADCDGPFYAKQDVIVVGGGDSALQEALVLAEYARSVHVVHRGGQFRAQPHLAERLAACANISVHWHTQVEAVLGEKAVSAVRVISTEAGVPGDTREIPCTGFFVYVGLQPACVFVPEAVARDAAGCLRTDAGLQTAMPGVFAAGAVRSGYGGLLSHACEEGIAAADSARAMLKD